MKGLTKTTVWEFLVMIQEKAKFNVIQIKRNNEKIKEYVENLKANNIDADGLIDRLTAKNIKIKSKNVMLLKLHQNILKINEEEGWYTKEDLDQLKVDSPMPDEAPSNEECLKWILNGKVPLIEKHPCLCDFDIVQNVYDELLRLERYEECKLIKKLQEKIQKEKD